MPNVVIPIRCTLVLLLCLVGCSTSKPGSTLSKTQREQLLTAGNNYLEDGGKPPPAISKLHPVEIYTDRWNLFIALHRGYRKEQNHRVLFAERGYCIVPPAAPTLPANDAHWTFKILGPAGLYEYFWKK